MAKDNITISPWHHVMIQVEIRGKPPQEGTYYVNSMEPLAMKHGILAAAGIIDMSRGNQGNYDCEYVKTAIQHCKESASSLHHTDTYVQNT